MPPPAKTHVASACVVMVTGRRRAILFPAVHRRALAAAAVASSSPFIVEWDSHMLSVVALSAPGSLRSSNARVLRSAVLEPLQEGHTDVSFPG